MDEAVAGATIDKTTTTMDDTKIAATTTTDSTETIGITTDVDTETVVDVAVAVTKIMTMNNMYA